MLPQPSLSEAFPLALAYDSSKGEVFVFNGGGTVSVISDTTNAVVATVTGLASSDSLSSLYPITIAYDSGKGEIFASNATISDSTNAVVAGPPPYTYPQNGGSVAQNFGDVAYDSGKGEMFASGLILGIGVFPVYRQPIRIHIRCRNSNRNSIAQSDSPRVHRGSTFRNGSSYDSDDYLRYCNLRRKSMRLSYNSE